MQPVRAVANNGEVTLAKFTHKISKLERKIQELQTSCVQVVALDPAKSPREVAGLNAKISDITGKLYGPKGLYSAFLELKEKRELFALWQKLQELGMQSLELEKTVERIQALLSSDFTGAFKDFQNEKKIFIVGSQTLREDLEDLTRICTRHLALPTHTKIQRIRRRALLQIDLARQSVLQLQHASLGDSENRSLQELRAKISEPLKKPLDGPEGDPVLGTLQTLMMEIKNLKEALAPLVRGLHDGSGLKAVFETRYFMYRGIVAVVERLQHSLETFSEDNVEAIYTIYDVERELVSIRQLLSLLKRVQDPKLEPLFRVQKSFNNWLLVGDATTYEAGLEFCRAARLFEEAGRALGPPKESSKLNTRLHRTYNTLRTLFMRELKAALAPQGHDKSLWQEIVTNKPQANKPELVVKLERYMLRRVAAALFLNGGALDIELELLLLVVRNSEALNGVCTSNKELKELLDSYDKAVKLHRSDAFLTHALTVLSLIHKAKAVAGNPFAYIEACQSCLEFARSPVSALVQKEHKELVAFLNSQFDDLLKDEGYIPLKGAFRDDALENFKEAVSDGQKFITILRATKYSGEWHPINSEESHAFESFLTRVLAACLYSQDEGERLFGQELFSLLMDHDGYEEYRKGISSPTKSLITANTVQKIRLGVKLSVNEEKAFLEGPALNALTQKSFQLYDIVIHDALFTKVKEEGQQGRFSQYVQGHLKEGFSLWYERHERQEGSNQETVDLNLIWDLLLK